MPPGLVFFFPLVPDTNEAWEKLKELVRAGWGDPLDGSFNPSHTPIADGARCMTQAYPCESEL